MDEDHEALGEDPAAAFEALRAEVAALRNSLGDRDGRAAPDYAPTLGKMAATLAKIEAHPALQLTPDAFAFQVRQAREAAQQQGGRDMGAAIQRVDGAVAELARLVVQQRVGREQSRWLAIVAGLGAVIGIIGWLCLSGPIARRLPARWQVPERMAAMALDQSFWDAGQRLMRVGDPVAWDTLAEASALERANAAVLAECRQAVAGTGRARHCTVVLTPVEPARARP